jgi:hypothetical protein
MQKLTGFIDPTYIVYGGLAGVFLGLLFVFFFLYHRIRWLLRLLSRRKRVSPGLIASLRNLVGILLWTSVFGMCLFLGFFLRSYHAFTYERPVSEMICEPLDERGKASRVTLIQYSPRVSRQFLVRGDQWMIEGDILKWDDWLHFLGLKTRYRLTRLRGRYILTEQETREKPTVYTLVRDENDPFWRYLYEYGHRMPFVSTVYGTAVFQFAGRPKSYLLYVSSSGFVVKEKPHAGLWPQPNEICQGRFHITPLRGFDPAEGGRYLKSDEVRISLLQSRPVGRSLTRLQPVMILPAFTSP